MRRRQFLAVAGVALGAGCSGLVPTDDGGPPETATAVPVTEPGETTATDSPADDGTRPFDGRQVVDLETGPRTLALQGFGAGSDGGPVSLNAPDGGRLAVGFTEPATDDGPAVLRATLVNGNDWENTFRLREFPPFDETTHSRLRRRGLDRRFDERIPSDVETGLYLAPAADHDLVDEESAARRGPEGYWQTPDVPPKLPPTVTLAPGESVAGDYYVLGHEDRTGFPTGTYRFGGRESGLALTAWETGAPGPTDDSRFSDPVPPLPDADTPWFHEADASTPVFLEPERERVTAPGRVSFRLVNRSRTPIGGNPYDWGLYKLADGAWHRVAPWAVPMPASTVSPGEAYGYTLAAFHGESFAVDDADADLAQSVGRLGGGRYAFVGGFQAEGADAPAAQFDLDAPTVPLSVPEDATVAADGDGVTVTLPSWGDDDHPPDATLTVRRGGDSAGDTLIREVVARDRMVALESALAAVGDRDRAVVRADEHAVENVTGYDAERRTFAVEGTTYVAEKRIED